MGFLKRSEFMNLQLGLQPLQAGGVGREGRGQHHHHHGQARDQGSRRY
jgi:hypothetical protein